MKKLGLAALLWAVLLLCGCAAEQVPPEEPPQQEQLLIVELSEDPYGPAAAVNSHGTAVLKVDYGKLWTLMDQANGEMLAIAWDRRTDPLSKEPCVMKVYDPEGNYLYDLDAAWITCFGETVILTRGNAYENQTLLYRRSTGEVLRDDISDAFLVDGVVLAVGDSPMTAIDHAQTDPDGFFWIYDEYGALLWQRQTPEYDCKRMSGATWFVLGQEGKWGVCDRHGIWQTQMVYADIYSTNDPDCLCLWDGETYEIRNFKTGQTVLTHPFGVASVWNGFAVVWDSQDRDTRRLQLIDRQGTVLAGPCWDIDPVDADGDLTPELFRIIETRDSRDTYTFLRPDGTETCSFTTSDEVRILSARCALRMGTDGIGLVDLMTGKETALDRKYSDAGPMQFGNCTDVKLFWASCLSPDGTARYDLFREDGTLLLEGSEIPHRLVGSITDFDSALIRCAVDGRVGLWRTDGTWLYREPS